MTAFCFEVQTVLYSASCGQSFGRFNFLYTIYNLEIQELHSFSLCWNREQNNQRFFLFDVLFNAEKNGIFFFFMEFQTRDYIF